MAKVLPVSINVLCIISQRRKYPLNRGRVAYFRQITQISLFSHFETIPLQQIHAKNQKPFRENSHFLDVIEFGRYPQVHTEMYFKVHG